MNNYLARLARLMAQQNRVLNALDAAERAAPAIEYVWTVDYANSRIQVSAQPGGYPGPWEPSIDFAPADPPHPNGLLYPCDGVVRVTAGVYTDRVNAYPGFPHWYTPAVAPILPAPAVVSRCECGAEKAGCGPGVHSDWCPKSGTSK